MDELDRGFSEMSTWLMTEQTISQSYSSCYEV